MKSGLSYDRNRQASDVTRSRLPLPSPLLLAALPLAGCGFGLDYLVADGSDTGVPDTADADTDADSDTDSDADSDSDTDSDSDADLRIGSVNPDYGTTAGGQSVTITGGPFDSSVSVRFGGNAASIDSVTSSEIHLHTPAVSAEGAVDVQVSTDADSATLTSGFNYFEDATGKTGALGTIAWYHYVGPAWNASVTDEGAAWFLFTAPTTQRLWQIWTSTLDSCSSGYTPSGSLYYYDIGASTATWSGSNGSRLNFGWDSAQSEYSIASLSNSQFAQNGTYNLETLTGTDFPPFAMPNIARTPGSFNVTTPNVSGSSVPNVQRSAFSMAWSGGGGDYVLADLLLLSSDGTTPVEEVTCALNDDGSFTVPSGVWRSWATNRYVIISLGRATVGTGTVPYNNGDSEVAGVYFVVGVARTQ